jgi:hypothetical protein
MRASILYLPNIDVKLTNVDDKFIMIKSFS